MPRTGSSTSRTSKSRTKSTGRKSATKRAVRPKRNPPASKSARSKSASRSVVRHKIRTQRTDKVPARRTSSTTATRLSTSDAPRKRRAALLMKADNQRTMKRATANKAKPTAEETKKRTAAMAEPRPKASAVAKTSKPKATYGVPDAPPLTAAPQVPASRYKRFESLNGAAPRPKSTRGSKSKSFGFADELMQDYVMDDEPAREELSREPLELPLELLDPELVEVPRPTPKPKPKPVTSKRQQACQACGNTFPWLSVEQLCFTCLKRRLAQRKREDETYPGFTGEVEEEEDVS